ncbi:hypothetical protein AURANDRAFT_29293 [Aureococcus anophagefferens]|uniref:Uncharacterized protein n=1 Tax=Aureococcus anophagefferens TaxID=44056 RepID=F0YF27_AURAN|nr:hypothetical protein AURANDRAFT_29293 [Aureococcus anophagefferens]EGB06372.1 hypothetical protein AURANDRAFT_29293 [Aureococcus anophagefferens]|eukprot:XP_009038949.1 hypothetical protein AURANDRAFT_29293 [Aureococcus anophagefferens]
MYRQGHLGLVKSDKKAAKIYRRAVELGNVEAMTNLGFLYEHGSGVKLDKKKAEELYRTATDRGSALAQYNLGLLLYSEKKFEEALRYFALAADQGFNLAENSIGLCYRLGRGTEVDLGKARNWYERAAAKGNEKAIENLARLDARVPEAISFLGDAYRYGDFGLVKSDKKAAKIYRRAVELGDVEAMGHLARLYSDGSGVKLDKKKAERLYRTAADRGDADAQCNLAALLDSQKKFEEAFRYYALAADQGHTRGEHNLGCCYMDGEGTEVDLGKARYWFERAAAKGHEKAIQALARLDARTCPLCRIPCPTTHAEALAQVRRHVENEVPEAITCLGDMYRKGQLGLVKSDKKAAKIYRRAVELGDVDAIVNLGLLHETGRGVKLDKKKAERLYRAAADRGHATAQDNLGNVLRSEEKFEEAVRYFVLAADQGYTNAEHNLGYCYHTGKGTEVDLGKARYWYERAAAKGNETAIRGLAHLDARV